MKQMRQETRTLKDGGRGGGEEKKKLETGQKKSEKKPGVAVHWGGGNEPSYPSGIRQPSEKSREGEREITQAATQSLQRR